MGIVYTTRARAEQGGDDGGRCIVVSDLWTLQLMFCENRTATLVFRSEANARNAKSSVMNFDIYESDSVLELSDDFGLTVCLMARDILEAWQLQDCGRTQEASVELALLQARGQARANVRAASDPVLREAQVKAQTRAQLGTQMVPPGYVFPGRQ